MAGFRGGLVERYLRRQWKFLLSMKCAMLFSVARTRASVARNMMICLRVCRCSWRADSSGMRCSFFVDIPSEQGEEESEHFLVLSCWRMALIFWVIMHLRNLYKSPSFHLSGESSGSEFRAVSRRWYTLAEMVFSPSPFTPETMLAWLKAIFQHLR